MKGAVFISDERMRYAGSILKQAGYDIAEADSAEQGRKLVKTNPAQYDFILAPIRGASDGKMVLQNESFEVDEFLQGVRSECPIITGFVSPYMASLAKNVVTFQNDNTFANTNGALTAEGVLYLILKNTTKSIFEYSYDVTGTGRAGTNIANLLEKTGLFVRRVSHREQTGCITLEEWKTIMPADVVINTAPVEINQIVDFTRWSDHKMLIIDISSMRMKDEHISDLYPDITYIAAPPLPGLVAPESAGRILAEFVMKQVMKNGECL